MEVWRPEVIEGRRPEVLSKVNLLIALGIHVGAFAAFWLFAVMHGLFEPKETIIPIDLKVIVNENLDGVENEPPPLLNPSKPEPPKPNRKPKPVPKKVEPPKALEQMVTNIVKTVEKKEEKKEPPKKDPPKKEEPKKPEPPKKTKEELMKERIEKMRKAAVKNKKPVTIEVKNARESGNGRTAKQNLSPAEIQKLLNMGYQPGTENQLATSELQLGVSRIQMALNEKWEQLGPKVGKNGDVMISCKLNSAGGLVGVRIISSTCGDSLSDQAALSVARAISSIRGLPDRFLAQFMKETLTIRYRVRGR